MAKKINGEVWLRVKDVVDQCVKDAEPLQLSSIAKSIETKQKCQIFIQPWETKPPGEIASCVATCEVCVIRDREEAPLKRFSILPSRHHFIFYTPCTKDAEKERGQIAHELGHCALHWPLNERAKRLVWGIDPEQEQADVYFVEYSKQEEEEADAFACLLTANRPKPTGRPSNAIFGPRVLEKATEYAQKGLLQSVFIE